jgi:hypothetical protein
MLTPKQITDIIRSDDSLTALAAAEDWAGIVAAWPAQRLPDVRVGGGGTMDALLASGQTLADINAIYAAIKSLPVGEGLLTLLNASDGVNWCDPKTVALLQSLASQPGSPITDDVIAVLTALSYRAEPTPTVAEISAAWQQHVAADTLAADEIRHEVLLSCNRGTDGGLKVMARVTPVEFADGVLLRRGQPTVLANDVGLIAALSPIVEGLTQ